LLLANDEDQEEVDPENGDPEEVDPKKLHQKQRGLIPLTDMMMIV
jgi:hypothetical protein